MLVVPATTVCIVLLSILLQIECRLSDDKDLTADDRMRIRKDVQSFLAPIREKLLEFEQELKGR